MATGTETSRLIIQVGDGGDPETFAFTCGANTYGITLTNNTGESTQLDCDNPLDVPAVITRYLTTQDTSATIAGKVTIAAWPTWRGWADSGAVKNVKIFLDESAANNGGFWVVPVILQSLELTKENSDTASFSVSLIGAGTRTWTDAT